VSTWAFRRTSSWLSAPPLTARMRSHGDPGIRDATRHCMRKLVMFALLLFASTAYADRAPADAPATAQQPAPPTNSATQSLPAIDLDQVPLPCQGIAKLAGSPSPDVALSARVSLASCMVDIRLRQLSLIDCEKSVLDVQAAAAPSLQILDDVIAANEPAWKMIALHAKGDLLSNLSIRMLTTVPQPAAGASEDAWALHGMRVQMLIGLVQPWVDQSRDTFKEVDRLSKLSPELAKNQAVRSAVLDSRSRLAAGVATR
jgi:hypothetical protein